MSDNKNALAPFAGMQLPAVPTDVMDSIDEVSTASEFLPRIQLISKGKYVNTKKIGPGNWGIPLAGGEEITDLGDTIDIIPLDARPKALDVSDKENIISVYDVKDPEFQRIKNQPKPKDGSTSGCMWGPSYLILERSTGKLYELFFSNKTGRQEAGKLKPFLLKREPCTLSIRYKPQGFGYHVPVVSKCSEPFASDSIPSMEVINAEIEKFRNPEKGGDEQVSEEEAPTGRAR
jgi:hypothetical protein